MRLTQIIIKSFVIISPIRVIRVKILVRGCPQKIQMNQLLYNSRNS